VSNIKGKQTDMTPEEFVISAIKTLRDTTKSLGIHTVISGFNEAFRMEFPDLGKSGPVDVVNKMVEEGKIVRSFRKGGAMIYLPGEEPSKSKAEFTLDKIKKGK
jgi:hypothetical protein